MREGERDECSLDGDGVDRESGGSGFGDGDVEVGTPPDAFSVDPFVFVLGDVSLGIEREGGWGRCTFDL